jgi:cell fate regulator YaaT (PSP1 superfamily)
LDQPTDTPPEARFDQPATEPHPAAAPQEQVAHAGPEAPRAGGGCGVDGRTDAAIAVVGVRLHGQVRVSQFNARGQDFDLGERVMVEVDRGTEVGEVVQATTRVRKTCGLSCMPGVIRLATPDDLRTDEEDRSAEASAFAWCRDRIRERNMPMRLVRVERSSENRRLVFQFTAEGRVDFRELVRDLAQRFRTRIEMRQIGVRDEAAAGGGYGPCGRALCCSTFLRGFAPISIKMAKAQKLSLNPSKLSGMCGRLKCCLRYEYDSPGGEAAVAPEDEPLPPSPAEAQENGALPPG